MKTKSKSIFSPLSLLLWIAICSSTLHAGSLWREGVTDERGMVADKRAKRVGDILTIVVDENVGMTNSLQTTTAKTSNTGFSGIVGSVVNQFLANLPVSFLEKRLGKNNSATTGALTTPTIPQLPVTGTDSFSGGGSIANNQTITGRAAVQVSDVLPNGNLVIEGLREVSFSKERQFESLHGVVRPYDINPDNTVSSSNVAGAQIQIVSEGTLTDAQKKGWLARLNDKVSPY